jgi:hypothetical protein
LPGEAEMIGVELVAVESESEFHGLRGSLHNAPRLASHAFTSGDLIASGWARMKAVSKLISNAS